MRTVLTWLCAIWLSSAALGQGTNPVYVDDSPTARDSLARARELAASGNMLEATRSLQRLLDQEPERLVATPRDPDLYWSVRDAVHNHLLQSREMLDQYRATEQPTAQWMLEQGQSAEVEQSRLLTTAGFEATLREAERLFERGHFEAARLRLLQLETHPDRLAGTQLARDAARMLARVARYIPGQRLVGRVEAWAMHAGLDPEALDHRDDPPGLPPLLDRLMVDPFVGSDAQVASPVSETPLAWGKLAPPETGSMDPTWAAPAEALADDLAEGLWIHPTVVEDTLYLNDGIWISAWDRYTLDLRWVFPPAADVVPSDVHELIEDRQRPRIFARRLEDANAVTVHGRMALAATGFALDGRRDGDGRLHALDTSTGRPIWSVDLPALDARLAGAAIRGPVAVHADVAVVAARRVDRGQRIQTVMLAGLDLKDGSLRWLTQMGSAGHLPYARNGGASDAILLHRGLAIRVDDIGIVAAIEIASGRPYWVRSLPSAELVQTRSQSPWQTHQPVPVGDEVMLRTPDRREIVSLAYDTGDLVRGRDADALGHPDYLMRIGDRLALVTGSRVATLPIDGFQSAEPLLSAAFNPGGIRGRVIQTGADVLVPFRGGIASLDPEAPETPTDIIELDRPGTVLSLSDQLIVLDDFRVGAHLTWEVAERVLERRIAEDPTDPIPAVMLAEVAYRASKPGRVARAADVALDGIDASGDPARAERARERLFRALHAMVGQMEATWEAPARPVERLAPITDLRDARAIVTRLGRAAASPQERVIHLLSLGRLEEVAGAPRRAIDAYQRLLAEPALAQAAWQGAELRRPAQEEASIRVRSLVRAFGPGSYDVYDAEARRAADALGLLVRAEELEALAARYPSASVSSELWARAAEMRASRNDEATAVENWSRAVDAAASRLDAGGAVSGRGLEALAGSLIAELDARGRVSAAAHSLARLMDRVPSLSIERRSGSRPASNVLDDLRADLRDLRGEYPDASLSLQSRPAILPGWTIMQSRDRSVPPAPVEHLLALHRDSREVALFGVSFGESSSLSGSFRKLWSIPIPEEQSLPVVVRAEPDAFILFWPSEEGGVLERREAVGGGATWRSKPFATHFRADPAYDQHASGAVEVPGEGRVVLSSQLFVSSGEVIVLVQRAGRSIAFDARTGDVLWSKQTRARIVADADADAERLLIVGQSSDRGISQSIALTFDIATGRAATASRDLGDRASWGLLADDGMAVVGLENVVLGLQLEDNRVDWRIEPMDRGADVMHAWIVDDLLILLDAERRLWTASASSGSVHGEVPIVQGKLRLSPSIDVYGTQDGAAIVGPGGIILVGADGRFRGEDALDERGQMLTPEPFKGGYITMLRAARANLDGHPAYVLHAFDAESARLIDTGAVSRLWDPPSRLAVLDGWIAVTAGRATLIYRAPPVPTLGSP